MTKTLKAIIGHFHKLIANSQALKKISEQAPFEKFVNLLKNEADKNAENKETLLAVAKKLSTTLKLAGKVPGFEHEIKFDKSEEEFSTMLTKLTSAADQSHWGTIVLYTVLGILLAGVVTAIATASIGLLSALIASNIIAFQLGTTATYAVIGIGGVSGITGLVGGFFTGLKQVTELPDQQMPVCASKISEHVKTLGA